MSNQLRLKDEMKEAKESTRKNLTLLNQTDLSSQNVKTNPNVVGQNKSQGIRSTELTTQTESIARIGDIRQRNAGNHTIQRNDPTMTQTTKRKSLISNEFLTNPSAVWKI